MAHTLLLADDSVTIQRVIELTFADEDVNVVAVSDGDQAIARIEQSPPDIVLADVGMPGKTGYEVAQHIKHSAKLSHIPVILLTGAFEPVDEARANEARCDGVLAKPFEPQLVIGRVRELLGQSEQRGSAAPAAAPTAAAATSATPEPAAESPTQPLQIPVEPAHDPVAEVPLNSAAPHGNASIDEYFDRLDAAFATLSSTPAKSQPEASAAPPTTTGGSPSVPPAAPDIDWFGAPAPHSTPSAEPWNLPAPPADLHDIDVPVSYASPATAFQVPGTEVGTQTGTDPGTDTGTQPLADAGAETQRFVTPVRAAEAAAPADVVEPVVAEPPATPVAEPPAQPAAVSTDSPVAVAPPPAARPLAPSGPVSLPPLADAFAALLAAEQGQTQPTAPSWPVTALAAPAAPDDLVEQVTRLVLQRLSDQTVRDTVTELVSNIAERLVREEIERIKAALR